MLAPGSKMPMDGAALSSRLPGGWQGYTFGALVIVSSQQSREPLEHLDPLHPKVDDELARVPGEQASLLGSCQEVANEGMRWVCCWDCM